MASLMIHLLVGQEYCKTHQVEDEEAFLKGNLAPDLVADKAPTHYTKVCRNKNYTESISNKVNLPAFCADHELDSDFVRGKFLHLITDYAFFSQYLVNNEKYLSYDNENILLIHKVLYRDYHRVNDWLMKSYDGLRLDLIPDDMKETRTDDMEILSKEAIERLVAICSEVNLDKAYANYRALSKDNEGM
ncbi:MAG: hypothetical protein E7354_02815 [Clostridiales bacterium]|nr:hypothetical protein [Clostridiales bacterium]